jgi:hypothetical protein
MMSFNDEPPPTKKEYVLCESYNRWFSRTEYQSVREHIWFSTEFEGNSAILRFLIWQYVVYVVNVIILLISFFVLTAVLRSIHHFFLLCRTW